MASSAYNPTMLYDPGDHQTSALPAPLQTNVNPPQPQWSLSNNPIFAPYPVSLRQVPAETSTGSQGNTQRIFDTNMPVIGGLDMNQTGNQGMRRDMKEDTPPAKKKTRNRKPASCAPCRKKKLRCDRLVPCSACQQRGEAHLCSWENAVPLYLARDMNDMAELRAQVDRLQALVDVLANPNNGGNLNLPEAQQRVLDDNRALSNASQQEEVDLKANDLCEALSHLAISQIMRIDEPTGEKLKETQIFDEARTFCAALPQAYGLSTTIPSSGSNQPAPGADTAASSLARLSYASETATVKDALKCMPLLEQANSALSYYFSYVDWYLHACHTPTFHFQMQRLRETAEKNPDAVDPFFLAVYLSLCGVGLAMMPSSRARRDGFPVDKDKLANTWLEGAMIALTAGKFLDTPTLDAIRALIIINAYFVFMATGESVNGGISILTMAVQLAVQLGLNRDPDRMDKKFTYLEAEDRRRIFWTLFHLLTLSSSSLGRTWSNFDMEAIDVKLPDDMNDEDFSKKEFKDAEQTVKKTSKKETVMTSLLIRIRIAQVAVKISKRAFGIKGVTYSEIFQLDSQIREIEDNLPPFYLLKFDREDYWNIIPPSDHVTASEMRTYMIWIGLAQEYIRIHRPYLILGYHNAEYAYSRSQCLKYSKIILAISRMPAMKQKWGGLTYKVISGAIILGIELLQNPEAPDAKLLRSNLSLAKQQLEFFADVSSLGRRGSKVLQFLEEKDNTRRNSAAPPSSKSPGRQPIIPNRH
ncbi:hypothetical protein BT69DRAFT_1346414 [Atractiella rhizophila]|nr:hypothetical protein BT69DRAFT_1346414 [Atractiella rhizophila]